MSRKTTAAIAQAPGKPLVIDTLEAADPGPGQVLVRVMASGVCHTDESVRTGAFPMPLPAVLGHEGAGLVEAVGPGVTALKPGDKVIGASMQVCGACPMCHGGQPEVCDSMMDLAASSPPFLRGGTPISAMVGLGTFSELMTVNQTAAVKVETDVPFEQLALLSCGVLTGVGAALNAGRVKPGDTVAVVGCGGVGLSMIQGARIASAGRIIAIDPVAMKREAALKLGATDTVDASADDALEQVMALTNGRGVDVALEAVGHGATIVLAYRATRRGGTCVAVGVGGSDPISIPPNEFVLGGKTLRSSLLGSGFPHEELPRLVRFVERGVLKLDTMVTKRMPLRDVNTAFELMAKGEALRSVLVMN